MWTNFIGKILPIIAHLTYFLNCKPIDFGVSEILGKLVRKAENRGRKSLWDTFYFQTNSVKMLFANVVRKRDMYQKRTPGLCKQNLYAKLSSQLTNMEERLHTSLSTKNFFIHIKHIQTVLNVVPLTQSVKARGVHNYSYYRRKYIYPM